MLTAGIAVFIITAYYFISYQPEVDPFQRSEDATQDSQSVPFKPNPIDEHLLKSCRWLWRGMVPQGRRAKRVEKSLIKVWTATVLDYALLANEIFSSAF